MKIDRPLLGHGHLLLSHNRQLFSPNHFLRTASRLQRLDLLLEVGRLVVHNSYELTVGYRYPESQS
ncbi:hypothetical protein BHE74_00046540, partial [Ensete ventricosum]